SAIMTAMTPSPSRGRRTRIASSISLSRRARSREHLMSAGLREFIYLDTERVRSLAAQLRAAKPDATEGDVASDDDRVNDERSFMQIEPSLLSREDALTLDSSFDFTAQWNREHFADGQIVHASGIVRLFDFSWLSMALSGLPAVLKKMSKLEMEALRNSDEG